MSTAIAKEHEYTLAFEDFWLWLERHHNCIVRVGTPGALLYDLEDLHWHLSREDHKLHVVSLCKAKDLIGEIIIPADDVAYVQITEESADEHVFEVLVETPISQEAVYHFVMSHGYEDDTSSENKKRWAH